MELGDPTLYTALTKASRSMDMEYLEDLGPMARALGKITLNAEHYRSKNDKIETGMASGGVYMNLAGSFLLFNGGQFDYGWLEEWQGNIKREIKIPCISSFFENIGVALSLAFPPATNPDTVPVLIVMSCQNYNGFKGVRLNSEAYTPYPHE